jgi:DNA-binding Lrp family transcriptional regulator
MSSHSDVLGILRTDARTSVEDIARQTGLKEADVEEVIAELEDSGVIKGFQAVVDWDRVEDEPVRAVVELNVTLDRETSYNEVAERVAKFPNVESLQLVSGDYDLLMEVRGESMSEVSSFISEKVAPVPEITQTVSHYMMDTYKKRGIELGDGHDDDRLSVSP